MDACQTLLLSLVPSSSLSVSDRCLLVWECITCTPSSPSSAAGLGSSHPPHGSCVFRASVLDQDLVWALTTRDSGCGVGGRGNDMPTVVSATWESALWLHFSRTEVPKESGVGAPRPCLGSCLDGLFWSCFLESSRQWWLRRQSGVGVSSGRDFSEASVSSAGRCWHNLTSPGDRSSETLQQLRRTVLQWS